MTKIRLLLRDLRQAQDLSQEELARALSLSRQSIISLERGEYLPSSPVLLALMEFFNCQIHELVEGIQPVNPITKPSNNDRKGGDADMNIAPWNPFQALDRMHDDMNSLIERNFGRGDWSRALGTVAGALNIHETDTAYEVEVQLPGYSEEDITLEMTEDTLTISGAKNEVEQDKKKTLIRREWQQSEFSRSIRFATPIKDDQVEAKLTNGTLLITAPKVEPVKPKTTKIAVKKQ